jgi:tetratricopeptide (TPR) repeat protein
MDEDRGVESGQAEISDQAADYLNQPSPRRAVPLGPVLGLVLLGGVTAVAFAMQGRPVLSPQGPENPSEVEVPHPGEMPVSASFGEAVSTLEAALAATPDDTLALASLVELMLSSHQGERAVELTTRWLDAYPGHPEAMLQRVMAYSALERWDEALEANRALYDVDPSSMLTRLNMGALYGNIGDADEARRWWTGVVEASPGTNEATVAERSLGRLAASTARGPS